MTTDVFTGLVQGTGVLERVVRTDQSLRLELNAQIDRERRRIGASIAVSGVCLTVVDGDDSGFVVDVAFETLARTTLGDKAAGARVNLEPSLRLGDALDGHWVTGHVDGVGRVRSLQSRGSAREVWIDLPVPLHPFVAAKGSICVDGVSLTVNDIDRHGFCVGLIPHTLSVTTLSAATVGTDVNVEVDIIARYAARLLQAGGQRSAGLQGPPSEEASP